jgi:PIN domain nuclease of toxin-antitoxin system
VIVLDTCVLLYEAHEPERIRAAVRDRIQGAADAGTLWVSDISLWEIAMLAERGRIVAPPDFEGFLVDLTDAFGARVCPISAPIATLTSRLDLHKDPADRIIAATAVHLGATLDTSDRLLLAAPRVPTLW